MKTIIKAAVILLVISILPAAIAGCGKNSDNPDVLIIGSKKIPQDEFLYFYHNTKTDFDSGDESFWEDSKAVEKLYSEVIYTLRRNLAIDEMAKQYKVKLDSNAAGDISGTIKSTKESYSDISEFYAALEAEHMSERVFEELLRIQMLWQKLYNYVTDESSGVIFADDAKLLADIPINFYRATHILIMNDAGDNPEENKTLAKELHSLISNGSDFEQLKNEYGEDAHLDSNTDGYYFTHGQMIKSFEETVKSLEPGETSGVVESVYGFHIIRRLPLEESYIYAHLEELRTSYMARIFNDMLKAKAESYNIKYTDAFKTLDILSAYDVK